MKPIHLRRYFRARRSVAAQGLACLALGVLVAGGALLSLPRVTRACGGTPPPPPAFCGKGYAFGKVSPGTIAVPAGSVVNTSITTWHYLRLIEWNPMTPVCPPPPYMVTMTITVGNCVPGGPGAGPIVVGPFPISQGLQTVVVPITIPAGPARQCTISVSSTVTFTDGTSVGPLTGDAEICIVDELPGQPGVPRLDLELLSPETVGMHAGDQAGAVYRVTNNDPVEPWTGFVTGDFRNTAKQPGEAPPGPVRLAYALADPGPGDQWPLEFAHNLPPGGCIPLPPAPHLETTSEITSEVFTLDPGEFRDLEIIARPWGMCADGSCGESTVVASGVFDDGTTGLACAGALYYVDNTLPPLYAWPDSGATVLFGPGSLPFEGSLFLAPEPEPSSHIQMQWAHIPIDFLVNGLPHPADRIPDTGSIDAFTGRAVELVLPTPPPPVDSFFDIVYRIEFSPPAPVDIEIVQMNLVSGAPAGFESTAPMAMGLGEIDSDGDFAVDSFFDIFYQVSGYAELDGGDTVPIQIVALELTSVGNGFDVHVQGSLGGKGAERGEALGVVSLTMLSDLRGYARAVPPPPCIGDLDGDNDTDVFDFGIFLANFGTAVPPNTNGDFDGNGFVNVFDFALFAGDFGCN